MRFIHLAPLVGVCTLALSGAVAAQEVLPTIPVVPLHPAQDEITFKVKTRGGFGIESSDGMAGFELEGRAAYDVDVFDGLYNLNGHGDSGSESELRRLRFGFSGWYTKNWNYSILIDIEDGDRAIDDSVTTIDTAMLQYTGFKYADLTIGRFKRPVSMEVLTSSNWLSFNEQSFIWELAPANDIAKFSLMASKLFEFGGSGLLYQFAVSDDYQEDLPAKSGSDSHAINARAVYTPWAEKGRVLHFGASYGDQNPGEAATTRVRSRLGVHGIDRFVLLDTIDIDSDRQYALEAALIQGPFSLQAEYVSRAIGGRSGDPDVDVDGWYLQGTWTLTGEPRGYKRKDGRFDRVDPKNKDYGAVELVARAQQGTVSPDGGTEVEASGYQFGVNWYPLRSIKLMLDYTTASVDNIDTQDAGDDGNAITSRIQWVF
ncbi:hypothetical protein D0B54_09560 [Solimonas sp. K1W22B-7]|uniref:OprO/OprP family phosphate-selective porin n=1 Tax=Solimonas sp. K1W22B-7 TaxID=2303331 RepID=UPI000E332071|nr:porin [Solimonas sp. K1W22B-7]AXQ28917.1 hypothetical protein D0B54_09560 [Solimonas sp. K1W22B-7]